MKTLIISHRDEDGLVSAVGYAWNILEKENKPKTLKNLFSICDIIDYQYYNNIYDLLKERKISLDNYKSVVLIDCSFPLEYMKEFVERFKDNFIWIDHHKRRDEDIEKELQKINGLRSYKNSASVLVWKYFNKGAPEISKYIEDMDIWKWKLPKSKEFSAGFIETHSTFTKEDIKYVFHLIDFDNFKKNKKKIINKGKIIREHQREYIHKIKDKGKIVKWEGYKTFIINTIYNASFVSEFLFELPEFKNIDIIFVWHKDHKENKTIVSIRTHKNNIDLSLIAKKYGGGGHPAASGFNINDINEINFKK